jgi:cell division protein ZapA
MPHVNVTIDGKPYRMACEAGQEAYLQGLAQDLDRRIAGLRASFADIAETRLLVMAALMIADELAEKTRGLEAARSAAAEAASAGAAERAQATQSAIAAALNAASDRIERAARALNQSIGENVPIG